METQRLGPPELLDIRRAIAESSLANSRARLENERKLLSIPIPELKKQRQSIYKQVQAFCHLGSQVASERPLSFAKFHPTEDLLATCSWGGELSLFKIPSLENAKAFERTGDRLCGLEWVDALILASCDIAGRIQFWDINEMASKFYIEAGGVQNHRVSRIRRHPHLPLLVSACFDTTWSLFDLNRPELALFRQEGHAKEVYCIDIHPDGGLVGTGSFDGHGLIWDMRTGKSIMALKGHARSVLSLDFSSNGYHVATGSEDHSARVWDLRKQLSVHTLFPHTLPVTTVRFDPESNWLLTTSHDQTAKVWGTFDWKPLTILSGHENKIMNGDIKGKLIATSCYDRSLKLWACGS